MTSETRESRLKTGTIYATLAYLAWGFFPIYWKFLKEIPALEILCNRVIWAFVFYSIVLAWRHKKLTLFWPVNLKTSFALLFAATLLMGNWFVYIYAVNSNQIIESSLGYFINPLVNISLGVFLLKEKLTVFQKIAACLATIGVAIISLDQGHLPWIALFLAFSFSFYGLIKKLNPVPGLESNQFESLIMLPLTFGLLVMQKQIIGTDPFPMNGFDWATAIKLSGAGVITGLPLIFFAEAAQRLPFYLLGFFQFLAPTFQFMTGVFLFNEVLTQQKLFGFLFIWFAGMIIVFNNVLMKAITSRDRK